MFLCEIIFVVVDLEIIGGCMMGNDVILLDVIIEIGVVKVCGGVVFGEFVILVNL